MTDAEFVEPTTPEQMLLTAVTPRLEAMSDDEIAASSTATERIMEERAPTSLLRQQLADAEARVRELEVDANEVEDALEVWSSMPCGCDGTHASLAELSKCLLDGAEAREQERGLLYNEALTLLLECDHGDERTCGCRDSAMERIAALARRTP